MASSKQATGLEMVFKNVPVVTLSSVGFKGDGCKKDIMVLERDWNERMASLRVWISGNRRKRNSTEFLFYLLKWKRGNVLNLR